MHNPDILDTDVLREINDLREAGDSKGLAQMYRDTRCEDTKVAIKMATAVALDRTIEEADIFLRMET